MMKTFRQNKTNIQDVTTTAKKKQVKKINFQTIMQNVTKYGICPHPQKNGID